MLTTTTTTTTTMTTQPITLPLAHARGVIIMTSEASRMHLRAPKVSKFSGGVCPHTPLGGAALRQLPTSRINKIITAPPNQNFVYSRDGRSHAANNSACACACLMSRCAVDSTYFWKFNSNTQPLYPDTVSLNWIMHCIWLIINQIQCMIQFNARN